MSDEDIKIEAVILSIDGQYLKKDPHTGDLILSGGRNGALMVSLPDAYKIMRQAGRRFNIEAVK